MLKKICNMCSSRRAEIACAGKLLIRIGVGLVFVMAGWVKLNALGMVNPYFENMFGLPYLGTLVAVIEFVGGLLMIVGYQTLVAGVLLSIIMAVATIKVHLAGGFAEYQLTLLLGLTALGIGLIGPGRYSVEKCLCRGKKCENC